MNFKIVKKIHFYRLHIYQCSQVLIIYFECSAAMGKLDDFEPIIGEPKTEGMVSPMLPHIMYVDAPECSKLRIVVTDFKFSTWMSVKSVIQLEDMVCFLLFVLSHFGFPQILGNFDR